MLLIKKINNNFAIALDSVGEQIIVEGRGVGFHKMPYELDDLSEISHTYYGFNEGYIGLINSISQESINVANEVCAFIYRKSTIVLNPNLPFTLADHINFAIQRLEKGLVVRMPMSADLKQMYPLEYAAAEYALKVIKKKTGVAFPKSEISGIVLNIVNSEVDVHKVNEYENDEKLVERVVAIIESEMDVKIDRESVNFARFTSHMNYLLKRLRESEQIVSDNSQMYLNMVNEFPDTYACATKVSEFLKDRYQFNVAQEELLYLMLHINRVCSRS